MPITPTVKTTEVGGTLEATANMKDTPGQGTGGSFTGNVVFVCDGEKVTYNGADPQPFDENDDDESSIELIWKTDFSHPGNNVHDYKVFLTPKEGAKGSIQYAWTISSFEASSSNYERFAAEVGTFDLAPVGSSA